MNKEKLHVYNAHPVKERSKLKLKGLGYVTLDNETKLKDVMIQRSMIADNVFCFFFKPTITHRYLCINNKIPVIYGRVDYMRKLIRRPLMSVWLFFQADEEKYRQRHTLVGKPLDGKYIMEMEIDGEFEVIDDNIDYFPGRLPIIQRIEKILRDEQSVDIYKTMINDIEKNRTLEAQDLNFPTEIPKVTITKEQIEMLKKGEIDLGKIEQTREQAKNKEELA